MKIPEKLRILIITLSDRVARGEYEDLSGPRIRDMLSVYFASAGWNADITLTAIPDEADILKELITSSCDNNNIIITTGGTGIGPRDITVDTVAPLLSKQIPGIMEFIRVRYGTEKPVALLSRSVAGVAGNALIYTLPGSVRAVEEYMTEILKSLEHTIYMQYGIDTHGKH